MPSLTPLSADEIAELYGSIDDLIGTGNGVQTDFQTSRYPFVDIRDQGDDFIGVGDGIATAYQLSYFPIQPATLELHKTGIGGALLTLTTHYTVNSTTGAVTLTPAGVAFLATEQLHAKYKTTSTVELHAGTIGGALLTPVTHYTLIPLFGTVKLTAAGLTFLGTQQLHAKYQLATGLANILIEGNGGLRQSAVVMGVQREIFQAKDDTLRGVHETIEAKAIDHIEAERRKLQVPTAIILLTAGNFVQPGELVDETAVVNSTTYPYITDILFKPLYPAGAGPNTPDSAKPKKTIGLFGGSGNDTGNEETKISAELGTHAAVQAAGTNVLGNPGPVPARSGSYLRFDQANAPGGMIALINDQQTALAAQAAALAAFLADNPSPTDLVSAQNITDATQAAADVAAQIALNTAYLATITGVGPYPGLLNAALATRAADDAARQAEIATRKTQITAHLTTLYNARFFYIEMRTRLSDGTLRRYITTGFAITSTQAQIVDNTDRIDQIFDLIAAQ